MRRITLLSSTTFALAGVLATLSLSACNKPAVPAQAASAAAPIDTTGGTAVADATTAGAPAGALPPTDIAPPSPVAQAPAAQALPAAPPAQVAAPPPPAQQYQYVDRAASMSAAFAGTPPDYTVDYQGTRPWIWRSGDGAYRVVEQAPGGERYYYFMPGAPTPFLIRDPSNTYAYDQGRLVVVYDARGRPLPLTADAQRAALAGRYLARARALYVAAAHQKHEAAYAANWQARRAAIVAQQQQWRQQQQQNAAWRAWHNQHATADQANLDRERARRQAYAARLASAPPLGARPQRGADPAQTAALARQRQNQARNQAMATKQAVGSRQAQDVAPVRASQVEVDAARQNLAGAKAQAAAADPAAKARIMEAARARLRLALQAQARIDATARGAGTR